MLPQYLDKLSPERQAVFRELKRFSGDFTLAGGTAIMLQIGHRLSFDFDCFSEKELPKTILRKAKDIFGTSIIPRILTPEQLTFKSKEDVEITFVYHPYKPLKKPIQTTSLALYHLDDLAANKAYTIGRRGVWRDYVDLFFFLKWKLYTIEKIITLANRKFEGEFNEKLFLEQLTYFNDLAIVPTIFLKESYTDSQIKSFLEKQVEKYLSLILPNIS